MHGSLTASFEKLILDAEMLQIMQIYLEPIKTDPDSLAIDAIAEVGAGEFTGASSNRHEVVNRRAHQAGLLRNQG
jgi:trimethylamine--corrinoid protein Co-methyltransferase